MSPRKTYADLPEHVRNFLESLSDKQIDMILSGMDLLITAMKVGRVVKWLIILTAGAFIGAASLGDAVLKLLGWLKGASR